MQASDPARGAMARCRVRARVRLVSACRRAIAGFARLFECADWSQLSVPLLAALFFGDRPPPARHRQGCELDRFLKHRVRAPCDPAPAPDRECAGPHSPIPKRERHSSRRWFRQAPHPDSCGASGTAHTDRHRCGERLLTRSPSPRTTQGRSGGDRRRSEHATSVGIFVGPLTELACNQSVSISENGDLKNALKRRGGSLIRAAPRRTWSS